MAIGSKTKKITKAAFLFDLSCSKSLSPKKGLHTSEPWRDQKDPPGSIVLCVCVFKCGLAGYRVDVPCFSFWFPGGSYGSVGV